METTPVISTSHALGIRRSLIMLITVQGLMPKLRCIEVQHWIAVACRSYSRIHADSTIASFAICLRDRPGVSPQGAYPWICSSRSVTRTSSSAMLSALPNTSDRSMVLTLIPAPCSSFSLYRVVLNAFGRAPTAPMRARLNPRTTRHTPRNAAMSSRKLSVSG